MAGVEQQGVKGSRKRKKASVGKDRSKKQAASGRDAPTPTPLPVAETHGVGVPLLKPSLTSAAEGNLLHVASAGVIFEEPSKASSRHSTRSKKRRKKTSSKASTPSSSSSASSQRSKKGAIADSTKTPAHLPLESKPTNDQIRNNIPHVEVAVDGRSEDKAAEALSATLRVGSSSYSHDPQTSSGLEAQLASTSTSGVLQGSDEANRPSPDKTNTKTTDASSPTRPEKPESSSVRPADAVADMNKVSSHALPVAASTVGVTPVADYQAEVHVEKLVDSKSTEAPVGTPADSVKQPGSELRARRSEDADVVKHSQGAAPYKIGEEPLIQPTAPPTASASQEVRLSSDQLGIAGGREKDDSKRVGGVSSEAHAEGAQRKSRRGSSVYWSFYPLNVTFVTDMDSHEARVLCAAMLTFIIVMSSLLIGGVVLLLFANRDTSPLACTTDECMAAREYLAGLLNTSKDACSDFYGYVCDSWLARGPRGGSFHGDIVAASLARINESLWNHEVDDDVSEDTRLLLRVYRECHHYVSEWQTAPPLKKTLQMARKQLNWSKMAGCRDYRELVTVLVQTSLLVGFHTVMVFEILSDDGRVVTRLSRGKSLHQKMRSLDDQGGNLQSIFQSLLDVEAEHLPRILEFDAIVQRDLDVGDFIRRDPSDERQGMLEEFIDDLIPGIREIDWLAAVNDVLMPLVTYTARPSDLALASGIDDIRMVFKNLTTQGGIKDVSLYLASHLDADVLHMELSRSWASSDHMKTARFCLELVQRSHAFMWPDLAAKLLNLRGSDEVLHTMYSQLQAASKNSVMFTWAPEPMRPYTEDKVKEVQLTVVPEDVWQPKSAWTDMGHILPANIGGITESYENFVELFLKVLSVVHEKRLRNPPTIGRFIVSRLERRSELAYSRVAHSVVVPTAFESSPYLYSTGVPSYFNYATIGALLASSIADAIGQAHSSVAETAHRELGDAWWTLETSSQYNDTTMCLGRLVNRLGMLRYQSGKVEHERRDIFLRVQGLRLAYDGLVASFGTAPATKAFQQLWVEAQAVFFARFCLLSCDADQTPRPLPPRANCLVPLHNMPEFSAVFDCATREEFVAYPCLQ